jgi:uncharacterized protein (DUF3820 family)
VSEELNELTYEELMADVFDPVIPLGKHRGKYASQVDVEYLNWLLARDWLSADLASAIAEHLKARS